MELIKSYLAGLIILITAILANYLATQLGLKTWYDFLNQWGNGCGLSLKDSLWLFLFYPIILGGSVYVFNILLKNFF